MRPSSGWRPGGNSGSRPTGHRVRLKDPAGARQRSAASRSAMWPIRDHSEGHSSFRSLRPAAMRTVPENDLAAPPLTWTFVWAMRVLIPRPLPCEGDRASNACAVLCAKPQVSGHFGRPGMTTIDPLFPTSRGFFAGRFALVADQPRPVRALCVQGAWRTYLVDWCHATNW